jgi:hypothetical protein
MSLPRERLRVHISNASATLLLTRQEFRRGMPLPATCFTSPNRFLRNPLEGDHQDVVFPVGAEYGVTGGVTNDYTT